MTKIVIRNDTPAVLPTPWLVTEVDLDEKSTSLYVIANSSKFFPTEKQAKDYAEKSAGHFPGRCYLVLAAERAYMSEVKTNQAPVAKDKIPLAQYPGHM